MDSRRDNGRQRTGNGRHYSMYDDDDDDYLHREPGSLKVFSKEFEVMPIMNKLYDVMRNVNLKGFEGIHLPSLVACGDQSAGKTSVLESIVRQEFLPKGDEIQTRCPIELQLVHMPDDAEPYTKVLDEDDSTWITFDGMDQVRGYIQKRTDVIKETCPSGVTDKRIVVRICSPQVPDLTLVDLPGFLNVSMEEQDSNIISKIDQVVHKEISNPNSIILAVTAANNNIGTSRALKEALRVDPERKRTLAIITKLDLMERGTTCEDVLRGNKLRLKLGYIGVVNRGVNDTKMRRSIEDKLEEERMFLQENYPLIADKNGTPFLTRTISQVLIQKIYESLPSLRQSIESMLEGHTARLGELGSVQDHEEKKNTLLSYLEAFRLAYNSQIDGRRRNMDIETLSASAKIQIIFERLLHNRELFARAAGAINDEQIDKAIKNSHGLHNLFSNSTDDAFQEFARYGVEKIQEPVQDCAKSVHWEMLEAINVSFKLNDGRYPKLRETITRVTTDVIQSCFEECRDYLNKFMNAEKALVYSADKYFMDKLMLPRDNESSQSRRQQSSTTSSTLVLTDDEYEGRERKKKGTTLFGKKEKRNAQFYDESGGGRQEGERQRFEVVHEDELDARGVVKRQVLNYFDIVVDRVKDHVPKAIANQLVYGVLERLDKALTLHVYTEENVDELIKEAPHIEEERELVNGSLEKSRKAKEIIDELIMKSAGRR